MTCRVNQPRPEVKSKRPYLTVELRRHILSLERSNELLKMQLKALERERDYLQAKLIVQAINNDEQTRVAAAASPKMLNQLEDYKAIK